MGNSVSFTIYGEPKGKGRPRVAVRKFKKGDGTDGTFSQAYTPKDTVNYENLVKTEYSLQCGDFIFPDKQMLDMRIQAFYPIPKSVSKVQRERMINHEVRPTKKPDSDNIIKIIADSLNKLAYHDDSQIVDVMFRKFYSEKPRVTVTIIGLEDAKNGKK